MSIPGTAFAGRLRGRAGLVAAVALSLVAPLAVPAAAQTAPRTAETAAQQLRRMDAEIKALQRKVFPGGDGKFFSPEITAGATTAVPVGTPATSPVTDILARMDSLEAQLARLTAQVEEDHNRLGKLEAQLAALQATTSPAPAPASAAQSPTTSPAPATGATIAANTAAMTGIAPAPATSAPKPAPKPTAAPAAQPPADRVAAVRAIVKPQTADAGDDEYSYGFRLWEAKFYPEAQQQLLIFLDKYPRHSRISYGRNLLGRAYLDDGKPNTAATYFVQNYNADPAGARAPDSLLYLAVAMNQLKQTDKACVALAELAEKFPAVVSGRLSADHARIRAGIRCN